MKRLTALLMTLLLAAMCCTAHADGAELTWQRAVEMTQHLREIATGDYLTINGAPENIRRKAREWAAGMEGEPRLIVRADVMNSAYVRSDRASFLTEHPMVILETVSSSVAEIMSYMMVAAAVENVVTESEVEEIVQVNSQLNCEMIYAEEAEAGMGFFLVFYEDAPPVLILSTAENGAVSLRACFIPSTKLANCQNHGQVALWFMMNGITMTCSEVKP